MTVPKLWWLLNIILCVCLSVAGGGKKGVWLWVTPYVWLILCDICWFLKHYCDSFTIYLCVAVAELFPFRNNCVSSVFQRMSCVNSIIPNAAVKHTFIGTILFDGSRVNYVDKTTARAAAVREVRVSTGRHAIWLCRSDLLYTLLKTSSIPIYERSVRNVVLCI